MSGIAGKNHCPHSSGIVQQHPYNVPMFELLGGAFASDLFPDNTLTKMTPWIVVRNISNLYNTSEQRVEIPAGQHGIYSFCLQTNSHSVDDGESSTFLYILNNTTSPPAQTSATRLAGLWERIAHQENDSMVQQTKCDIRMDGGDYLDVRWKQASGGAVGMDADFIRWTGYKVIGKQGKTVTEPGNWDY